MFEDAPDVELIEVMGEATRDESTAIAQRLALVGELYARRALEWAQRNLWCTDPFEAVAAEVSAAQNISRSRAGGQIHYALVVRERLPRVARVFATGVIDCRMVATIIARTDNVEDAVMARLDDALARHAKKWMSLSVPKLPPKVEDSRYVEIGQTSPGMAGIWGNIHSADGAALDKRPDALGATVCDGDPRTKAQRRADACGPLARGEASVACQCGSTDCPAAAQRSAAAAAVIHVLAEQATLDGTSDAPGYLSGFGILPAESVRDLAKTAKRTPLTVPTGADPDPGYRPTAKTAEFIRWRDLTCRWPGCNAPAEVSDIDHTVAYPGGRAITNCPTAP